MNEDSLDPRWQKKRLKIMERDGFKCVSCQSESKTLHVHHKSYAKKLWASPDDEMQTLCSDCHSALGSHPKGGVYWRRDDVGVIYVYRHCPECGSEKYRDKGTWEKCANCGRSMMPNFNTPGLDVAGWGSES